MACQTLGGELVSIFSLADNDFVYGKARKWSTELQAYPILG